MNSILADQIFNEAGKNGNTIFEFYSYLLSETREVISEYGDSVPRHLIALEKALVDMFQMEVELKNTVSKYSTERRRQVLKIYAQRSKSNQDVILAYMMEVLPKHI